VFYESYFSQKKENLLDQVRDLPQAGRPPYFFGGLFSEKKTMLTNIA